ncbi:MAG: DNA polymerase III subunit beta [Nocardioidaceae bacterium]
MKFRIERDALADAVAWTARSLPTRPSVPVLAGLLIETTPDGLSLSGFDFETSARATVSAEVADEGKALVSGRLLADICRSLPHHSVEVALDATKVSLLCGSARFSLQTMPVEDYPTLPEMPQSTGTVRSDVFSAAVAQAVSAAGRDDMLPLLTGVRLEIESSSISMLATDRFRASLRDIEWSPDRSDVSAQALVPARVLADTAKALTAGTDVTIALSASGVGEGLIGFEGVVGNGTRRTTTRLLEGEFPRLRQLFAYEPLTTVWIDTAAFTESVKRVALVAERNTPVRLAFTSGQVVLEAGSGDEAQASEAVEARVDGADINTGFNPQYLLDGLGAVTAPVVHMAFTQHNRPAALAGAAELGGNPDFDFRYLMMPVRLQS